jgi:endonuclease/exonuclease/phosphatase family metal-dependent hydrolase
MRIHLISWNVHGPGPAPRVIPRMRAVAKELARRSPDLALLQEVWTPAQADLIGATLKSRYTRIDTPPGGGLGRTAGLLAFVSRASGWRVTRHRFEPFSQSAPSWKVWEGDALGRKGLLQLELRRNGEQLVVVNTHLQASYSPGGYTEVRRAQLAQLSRATRSVAAGVPVLVAGDLNIGASEPLYPEIERDFVDLSAGSGAWIDYVLLRRDPAWSASSTVERIVSTRSDHPYSDHQGLDVAVELTRGAGAGLEPGERATRALWGPSTRRAWLRAALASARRLL